MIIFQIFVTFLFLNIAITYALRWYSAFEKPSGALEKPKTIPVTKPVQVDTNEGFKKVDIPENYNNYKKIFNDTSEEKVIINKIPSHKLHSKTTTTKARTKSPDPRFLEVFHVVEVKHETCIVSTGLDGICLPEYKCKEQNGVNMGTCADGFGVCCVYLIECNEQTSVKEGWFNNPGYPGPNTEQIVCTVTLKKYSKHIVQIRLDFKVFELQPPTNGACKDDQFFIGGQNSNNILPILCGVNSGQHMYIEVGDVPGPIILTFQTISSGLRAFSIRVSQLTVADHAKAPTGCMQYHKGEQGSLESFNYANRSEFVIQKHPGYLNNLNYAMCIERAPEMCSVTYKNKGVFHIPNYDIDGLAVIPPGQAGVEILNCPDDWLLIAATRLCGDRLNDGSVLIDFTANAPVTDDSMGPIVVWFKSDEAYVGHGFKLYFQQNQCVKQQ